MRDDVSRDGSGAEPDESWVRDLAAIAPDEHATLQIDAERDASTDEPAPPPCERIVGGRFDEYLFHAALESVDRLRHAVERGQERYPYAANVGADVMRALYKPDPERQDVAPDYQLAATALDEAMSTSEFEALRVYTQLDEFAAAAASATLTHNLVEELAQQQQRQQQDRRQQQEERQQRQDEANGEQADATAEPASGMPGAADESGDESGGDAGGLSAAARAAARDRASRTAFRVAARRAAQQARQETQDALDAIKAFGGGQDDVGGGWGSERGQEGRRGDMRQRASLALRISQNKRLQAIARNVGRLQVIAAAAQRSRAEHVPEEVVGVEIGADLSRVLPAEMALLADPELGDLWNIKFLQRTLLQYELRGTEPTGKGPIVFCIDESDSMSGGPSEWAAAIALCLLSIAAKQRRDFRWIHFGSEKELLVEDYPGGRGTPERVLESALHHFSGGTDFNRPLRAALEAIEGSQYQKADVVFVTDGLAQVADDMLTHWIGARKQRDFRCYGMLVGAAHGAEALREFCDDVTNILEPGGARDADALRPAFAV